MKHKKQSGQNDCGVAAAAMVLGLPLRTVRAAAAKSPELFRVRGLTLVEMRELLEFFGTRWSVKIHALRNAKPLKDYPIPEGFSLLLIWPGSGRVSHWVAGFQGTIYDPKEHFPTAPGLALRRDFQVRAILRER